MDDTLDNDDDADDFVEVDVVVEGQIGGQLERPHQSHAVSDGHKTGSCGESDDRCVNDDGEYDEGGDNSREDGGCGDDGHAGDDGGNCER